MPLVYDNTRSARNGGGYIEVPDAAEWYHNTLPTLQRQAAESYQRSRHRWGIADRIAMGAATIPFAMAGGSALSGLFSGSSTAAPAASAAGSYSSPGVYSSLFGGPAGTTTAGAGLATGGITTAARGAGRLATLGKIFSSPALELGVNTALSVAGMRAGLSAADQARADQLAQNKAALELQRQQLEAQTRAADLDRADAKALNDALNELKRRELDAAEEERAFNRSLVEQRERRLAPYRDVADKATQRLSAMWGLG